MPDSGRPALTKSCQACVIAKRKCSRTLPQCQRCRDKDIICKYKNEPFSTDNNSTTLFLGSHSHGPTPADSIHHDQRRGLVLATRSNSTPLSLDYMLLNTPEVILTFDQPTVNYLTDHLRTFPMAFVRYGGTLFIHPKLYQDGLPHPLQDIFALCAIDIHHSQANQHIISRAISSTASHLIQSIPSIHTFISKLAFVQSLVLLQIMTLFSPTIDQALRKQAERRMPLLKAWAVILYESVPKYLPASMSPRQAWILAESCRRTIHMCHMVSGLYSMLKLGCFTLTLFVEALPLNRNGHLWDDNFYFNQTAPVTNPRSPRLDETDLISYRELTDLWEDGHFRQPGLFEEMLLAACKGISRVTQGAKAIYPQQVSVPEF